MTKIHFRPMEKGDIPLYKEWAKREHVRSVWFLEGYEPVDKIYAKVEGNGYDFPYIILLDEVSIGYIVTCDLYAYKTRCPKPKGIFLDEPPGTFCIDLFIGEEQYLDKGYGTMVVRQFSDMLLMENANRIVIDPDPENKRAVRCYEKAGFVPLKSCHDGISEVLVLEKLKPSGVL